MISQPIHQLSIGEVFQVLETSPGGLSPGEVTTRQALYGQNTITQQAGPAAWRKLVGHLAHPTSGLLWIAGVIAFFARDSVLGIVIWMLVLVNAGFSYWRERRTEQAMHALRRLLPAYARVVRNGTEHSIPANEVVPGDVLTLAEGDNIPADARVVEAYGLRTNNSILTGEAVPAAKTSDTSLRDDISEVERPNLVFAGTSVVSGTGRAVVCATGMLTQFGRIAHLTQAVRDQPSQLQVEMLRLTRQISIVAFAISTIIFVVGAFDLKLGLYPAFLLALGILAAAVPEGLPATITLSLAMAGQRLAQHNVLVKKLAVIESLGTVSTICTDKSGTLTQNQMTVREIWIGGVHWRVTGGGYEPKGKILPTNGSEPNPNALQFLLGAALMCNNSRLSPPGLANRRWSALGDQTEAAMRVAALKGGSSEESLNRNLPRIHELPFEARRKRMSTIHRVADIQSLDGLKRWVAAEEALPDFHPEIAFVKGAPREVLALSVNVVVGQEVCVLDDELRAQILAQIDAYARAGLRVLSLAFRRLPFRSGAYTTVGVERDLTFLGLMAMLDPPRPEVAEAIRVCKQAGIRMVMITGDYGLTAESLARRIGMLSEGETEILTGNELDELDDAQLQSLLDRQVVYARMAPEHKLRLVSAFQGRGEVVAVIGDGVNDAPALRKADVGVAMGQAGTGVAKEAADVILVDDNFAMFVHAIEEGRAVFDNLRKFMTYIFSSNVPEIMPFILTALFDLPLALTVRQILAIDLGTDLLPGLALGSEKPEPFIMQRKPRRRDQPLIDRRLLVRAFLWLGMIETLLAFSGFFLVYTISGGITWPLDLPAIASTFGSIEASPRLLLAITAYHAGVVMAQVGNAFASRSETHRGRSLGWLSNHFLLIGVGIEIGLIISLIYIPALARAFQHAPLPLICWLWLSLYPVVLYSLEGGRKHWSRRTRKKKEVLEVV